MPAVYASAKTCITTYIPASVEIGTCYQARICLGTESNTGYLLGKYRAVASTWYFLLHHTSQPDSVALPTVPALAGKGGRGDFVNCNDPTTYYQCRTMDREVMPTCVHVNCRLLRRLRVIQTSALRESYIHAYFPSMQTSGRRRKYGIN